MTKTKNVKDKYSFNRRNLIVKLKDIKTNIKNPRKGQYDRKDLDELKDSLETVQQLTALKVDENAVLLGGHRRLQAMKELKWTECKVDVIVGLSEFNKSAIMISDNATQRQFNAWESRQAISDIYWNEFCEEYQFKGANDKGYTMFGKKLGISKSQVKVIVESLSKDNLGIARKLKAKKIGTEVLDTILRSPKKYRTALTSKAIELSKGTKATREGGLREHLRMYKKALQIEERTEECHPSFFKTIHYKLSALGLALTKNVIKVMPINEKIKLKKSIEKHILPGYKLVKNCK